ncbi:sulfite exporter TauE/SafE family protein [Porifericola rhodea]|uniref:sulfite exporter TauE/SafE family protein n=1 Tax=Porifericola rhodea TaxID=930972 RepID=UPI0026659A8C|nr:sulfite exporter TauE/SafE family protein [Porifericola rhodea]WKN30204.1 sulfite exporter TauE/SafE family protein [Porifericola rhodea]
MSLIELPPAEWGLVIFCALMVGVSKAGVAGAGIVVIPILAQIFGGQQSTGFLLPMLVVADIFAVRYYNRHAQWSYLARLLPWTLAGIGIGVWVGDIVSDEVFKEMIAVVVFVCLILMVWKDSRKKKIHLPQGWWFSAMVGLAGGFATMIGNAAGPIMAVYLLSMHLPKNHYIGTAAWFFLIINVLKLPLQMFVWHTISYESLTVNLAMVPVIVMGVFIGIVVVKKFPERAFRIFVIFTTALSSLLLFF